MAIPGRHADSLVTTSIHSQVEPIALNSTTELAGKASSAFGTKMLIKTAALNAQDYVSLAIANSTPAISRYLPGGCMCCHELHY
jgi:hypothetical protein